MAEFLLILPILLLSVVAHEYAHAWTAYHQGDTTAYDRGRLTLNPLPHLDLFSSILLPVMLWVASKGAFTFGSARPVPIDSRNFRHFVRGDILVSSAGIAMNLVLAGLCTLAFMALGMAGQALNNPDVLRTIQYVAGVGIAINVLLAVFNLIPLPPLDGSHLFYHLLPRRLGAIYQRVGRFGFLLLILTIWLAPGVWDKLLAPATAITQHTMAALRPWSLGPLQ